MENGKGLDSQLFSPATKSPRTGAQCFQMLLSFLQMFTLPQKESNTPTTCPGPASTQDLDSNHGDGQERECSRKPDWKLPEFCGVGDPTATVSSDSSHLSSRGSIIKWFWDSAEEGYRTYHMDEYDEDKNPSVSEIPIPAGTQGGIPYLDH